MCVRGPQTVAKALFHASLEAVNPYKAVGHFQDAIRHCYEQGSYNRFLVVGFGKGSCAMAAAIEEQWRDSITEGIVITTYGHCSTPYAPGKIRVYEGGHPLPDENGLKSTGQIVDVLKTADAQTFIVCLISGGGSALLVSPCEGLTLGEKRQVAEVLLKAGASIGEFNTVRKHLSRVKGGRLAEIAYPARIVSLILSDVIGDKIDTIASGPTAPDDSTFQDALDVIEKYQLASRMSENVFNFFARGSNGLLPETPKKGDRIFQNVDNIIIASNSIALNAAREKAEKLGLQAEVLSSELTGEARELGKRLAHKAMAVKNPVCLISGGETTVTVKGTGVGGRNMELALSFAMEIQDVPGITLLSAGTDGIDGTADAAGALVDGETIGRARSGGLDPEAYLANNDSYTFFKNAGGLLVTGPTGTNVMDIQILVIDR